MSGAGEGQTGVLQRALTGDFFSLYSRNELEQQEGYQALDSGLIHSPTPLFCKGQGVGGDDRQLMSQGITASWNTNSLVKDVGAEGIIL